MSLRITPKQWLALCGISLLTFTIFLDGTIVANALPTIQIDLSASYTQAQWLLNLIPISLCALMTTLGRLGDIYGLRKTFYISMALMAVFSLACGLAQNIEQLIVFRALQAMTLASVASGGALISHNFDEGHRAKAMAFFASVGGAGLALGPVLGGFIVHYISWRWVFFINVPIVALGIALCIPSVIEKTSPHPDDTVDWLGAFLFIVGMVSLVTTTIEATGWSHANIWTGYLISAVSFILFFIVEAKVQTPILPFKQLANGTFIACATACGTCGAFIMVFLFFDPLYLQTVLNKTPVVSGWLLLSTSITYILITPLAGTVDRRYGAKAGTMIVPITLILAALFHAQFTTQYDLLIILLAFIPFGIAWGAVNVSPAVAVMKSTTPQNTGIIIGSLWTFFNVGAALGLAILGLVFRHVQIGDLTSALTQKLGPLTSAQNQLIYNMVQDPEHSQTLAAHFSSHTSEFVLNAYTSSFAHAFNTISWMLFGLAIFSSVFIFTVMKTDRN